MDIVLYGFENKDGNKRDYYTQDFDEAREYAQTHGLKWIAYTFTFSDSELVLDYTDIEEETA